MTTSPLTHSKLFDTIPHMVDRDPREQIRAAQKSRLAQIQQRHQLTLEDRGTLGRVLAAAYKKFGDTWSEERTPQTRFVVSLGAIDEPMKPTTEYLYVTRFEGEERQWGIEVGSRVKGDFSTTNNDNFTPFDANLVSVLANQLARAKRSGELSGLNFDLDSVE